MPPTAFTLHMAYAEPGRPQRRDSSQSTHRPAEHLGLHGARKRVFCLHNVRTLRDGWADGLRTTEARGGAPNKRGLADEWASRKAYLVWRPRVWCHQLVNVLAFLSIGLLSPQVGRLCLLPPPHVPAHELNCCTIGLRRPLPRDPGLPHSRCTGEMGLDGFWCGREGVGAVRRRRGHGAGGICGVSGVGRRRRDAQRRNRQTILVTSHVYYMTRTCERSRDGPWGLVDVFEKLLFGICTTARRCTEHGTWTCRASCVYAAWLVGKEEHV